MLATGRSETTFRISVVMHPLNFPGFNRVPCRPLVGPSPQEHLCGRSHYLVYPPSNRSCGHGEAKNFVDLELRVISQNVCIEYVVHGAFRQETMHDRRKRIIVSSWTNCILAWQKYASTSHDAEKRCPRRPLVASPPRNTSVVDRII